MNEEFLIESIKEVASLKEKITANELSVRSAHHRLDAHESNIKEIQSELKLINKTLRDNNGIINKIENRQIILSKEFEDLKVKQNSTNKIVNKTFDEVSNKNIKFRNTLQFVGVVIGAVSTIVIPIILSK